MREANLLRNATDELFVLVECVGVHKDDCERSNSAVIYRLQLAADHIHIRCGLDAHIFSCDTGHDIVILSARGIWGDEDDAFIHFHDSFVKKLQRAPMRTHAHISFNNGTRQALCLCLKIRTSGCRISRSKIRGLLWLPMRRRSLNPSANNPRTIKLACTRQTHAPPLAYS